ncbi:MAG: hypothetical protein RJB56_560 [Actinomycetota bacterium]|jgi:subtilisin family serine protease
MKKIALALATIFGLAMVTPAAGSTSDPAYLQIGVDSAWSKGYKGKDAVIAILERGIDLDHPAFKDRIIDGYCIVTESAPNEFCANGKKEMSGIEAAQRPAGDGGHGLGVAGAAASNATSNGPGGVAPEAKLLMVRAEGGDIAILNALERVLELKAKYNIVAVNMSFSRTTISDRDSTGNCDDHLTLRPLKSVFKRLREAGIIPFAASGNAPTRNENLSTFPACVSEVVAVGSTDRNGKIAPYVTASDKISFFAPDFPNVPKNIGYGLMGGTSTATPVAVGVFTVLRQAFPKKTDDQILLAMATAGTPIEDKWIKGKQEVNLKGAISFLSRESEGAPLASPSPTPSVSPSPLPSQPTATPTPTPPTKTGCQAFIGRFETRTIGKAIGVNSLILDSCEDGNILKVNGLEHFTWFGPYLKTIELPPMAIKTIQIISGEKILRTIDYSLCKLNVKAVNRPKNIFATTVTTSCDGVVEVKVNNQRVWITPMQGTARSLNLYRAKGQVANFYFMGNLKAKLSDTGLKIYP